MSELLPHIQLETGKNPNHAIIWLHGLGADGEDFVPVVDEMNLPVPVRYIFPHAPKRPVTLNGGFVMRAWYDVYAAAPNGGLDLEGGRRPDEAGIRASQAGVGKALSREQHRGIPAGHHILAGSSTGRGAALRRRARRRGPVPGLSPGAAGRRWPGPPRGYRSPGAGRRAAALSKHGGDRTAYARELHAAWWPTVRQVTVIDGEPWSDPDTVAVVMASAKRARALLESEGFEVIGEASDGHEALAVARVQPVDIRAPVGSCGYWTLIASIRKRPGEGKNAVAALPSVAEVKLAIVTDEPTLDAALAALAALDPAAGCGARR